MFLFLRFLSLLLNQLLRVAGVLVSYLVTAVARLIPALPGPSLPASLALILPVSHEVRSKWVYLCFCSLLVRIRMTFMWRFWGSCLLHDLGMCSSIVAYKWRHLATVRNGSTEQYPNPEQRLQQLCPREF